MEPRMLFSFLLVLQFTFSTSENTITMNQTLKDGDFLISEGKNFVLGFFSPGSSSYRYLGIWFHKVPLQTVVWVANRNNPITGFSGVLSIDRKSGNLVLYSSSSSNNRQVWSTNVSVEAADTRIAKLSDAGNLMLGSKNRILWQSFEHPTNTLLPEMKFGMNGKTGVSSYLSSWRSVDDPGVGNYTYRLNPGGSPQFYLYNGTKHYWRTAPWPWKSFSDLYNYNFVNLGEDIYQTFFLRSGYPITWVQLDESGFLRWKIWHEGDSEWKLFMTLPMDRCDFHGRCGANGKCDSNAVNRLECTCLPGHKPKSSRDWDLGDTRGGCIRKRPDSSMLCRHGDGFLKVEKVKLPDTSGAVWIDTSKTHLDCEQECKSNCSCSAYCSVDIAGNETRCLTWYRDLIDTRTYTDDMGYDIYVRADAFELESTRRSKLKIIPLIIPVASAWVVIIIMITCWLKNRKKKRTARKNKRKKRIFDPTNGSDHVEDIIFSVNELEGGNNSHPDLVFFDYSTILAATNNFSSACKIGQGGFGTVYKGQLSNGLEIAVKRMSKSSRQGIREFTNEVMLIAKLQHKNLVKLLGCCIEKKEQILIYEYLPNKSLDSFLFDEEKRSLIDWEKRFDIIVGIARGILYLHQDSRLTIIHRDLKSSNVLLDEKMSPKISDFGMARLFNSDQIQGTTKRVVGTYGYMSPEYALFGKFSVKSDVFSFGVILLEVISGNKSQGFHHKDPSMSLIGIVWELWSEGSVLEIVDSSLIESYNPDEALRCIQVGLLCVQEDAMERPTMLEVILMLKGEKSLPSPKQPAFILKTYSSSTKSPGEEEGSCSVNELTISAVLTR